MEPKSRTFCTILASLAILAFTAPACEAAAIHQYFIDPDKYPVLDQHDVCGLPNPAFGCGPTAATTSLAYLDETHLIPRADPPRPLYDDMVRTAGIIGGPSYMASDANGTTVSKFIPGMNKYLADKLTGVAPFVMSAQMGAPWPAAAGTPKPSYVADRTPPTWQYFLSKLEMNWAVQLGLDGLKPDGTVGGHWLTLTGFYFADFNFDDIIDEGKDIAYMRYIDPWSGEQGQADVWLRPGSGILGSNYVGAAHGSVPALQFRDIRLIAAVAEFVPEPGTVMLLSLGLVILATTGRRRKEPTMDEHAISQKGRISRLFIATGATLPLCTGE